MGRIRRTGVEKRKKDSDRTKSEAKTHRGARNQTK